LFFILKYFNVGVVTLFKCIAFLLQGREDGELTLP